MPPFFTLIRIRWINVRQQISDLFLSRPAKAAYKILDLAKAILVELTLWVRLAIMT